MNTQNEQHEMLAARLDELGRAERAAPDSDFESRLLQAVDEPTPAAQPRMPGRRRIRLVLPLAGALVAAVVVVSLLPVLQSPHQTTQTISASITDEQEADLLLASFDILDVDGFGFEAEIDVLSDAVVEAAAEAGSIVDDDSSWLWGLETTEASL